MLRGALRAAAQSSVRFARNEAGGAGGGLALYGGASASLGGSGLEFSRNAARVGGGLSLVDSQAAVLSRAVLDGNTAYSEGGAIYALASSAPAGLSAREETRPAARAAGPRATEPGGRSTARSCSQVRRGCTAVLTCRSRSVLTLPSVPALPWDLDHLRFICAAARLGIQF